MDRYPLYRLMKSRLCLWIRLTSSRGWACIVIILAQIRDRTRIQTAITLMRIMAHTLHIMTTTSSTFRQDVQLAIGA